MPVSLYLSKKKKSRKTKDLRRRKKEGKKEGEGRQGKWQRLLRRINQQEKSLNNTFYI